MFYPANTFSARHETLGADTSNSSLTNVTSNISANVKGSWTDIGGPTSFAYEAISVSLDSFALARRHIVDIGISDGTNSWVIAADLRVDAATTFLGVTYELPIHVPAGAQLSARIASSTGNSGVDVGIVGHSAGINGCPGFSRLVALYTPSSSQGVAINAGAAANTKPGSFTEVIASTPIDVAGILGHIGGNADVSRVGAQFLVDIARGAAGSEEVFLSDLYFTVSNAADGVDCGTLGPYSINLPVGTRLSARCQSTTTTAGDRTLDVALYGLVP